MQRIGMLLMLLLFCAFMVWAQDNTGNQTTSQDNTANQTTTNDQTTTTNSETTATAKQPHKDAADQDANAAAQEKADAKNEGTKAGEEHDKVLARLDDSSKILNELLGAPDKGIPDKVFENAKCVAVVPSMVKGGFVFGAEHGRGVAT